MCLSPAGGGGDELERSGVTSSSEREDEELPIFQIVSSNFANSACSVA